MSLPDRFVKMAGGGNDFLLFEADGSRLTEADTRRISLLCRRGLSVGADGALFLSGGGDGRVHLDYYNADGGLASFCANGTRCAARYAVSRRLVAEPELILETGWGHIAASVDGETVTLALRDVLAPSEPISLGLEDPQRYSTEGLPPTGIPIHVGVPHLVVFVRGDLAALPIERVGPPLRRHPLLPEGANVNFVRVAGPGRLEVRTWERGVEAETLSCGSGVVASALVASQRGHVELPVACATKSGVDLTVNGRLEKDVFTGITLTGDAREVYRAELREEAWKE
ncbi:MAG: diaminopimelate epimerase [Acidobacteriota bacterium]